jgi:hypothetical protein
MKRKVHDQELVRLSKEQLRDSRAGRLGRFPSKDLYEAEPSTELSERSRGATPQSNTKNEKPRKRSSAVRLG